MEEEEEEETHFASNSCCTAATTVSMVATLVDFKTQSRATKWLLPNTFSGLFA